MCRCEEPLSSPGVTKSIIEGIIEEEEEEEDEEEGESNHKRKKEDDQEVLYISINAALVSIRDFLSLTLLYI